MKDSIIWLGCILLVVVGAIVGPAFKLDFNFVTNLATIVGGFTAPVAFLWAINTYNDWKKTQTLNEYNETLEIAKSAHSIFWATTYLFENTTGFVHQAKQLTELQKASIQERISHADSIMNKGIERYNDARILLNILQHKAGTKRDFQKIDKLVNETLEIYWLLKNQQVEPAIATVYTAEGLPAAGAGIKIPDKNFSFFGSLGMAQNVCAQHFYEKVEAEVVSEINRLLGSFET